MMWPRPYDVRPRAKPRMFFEAEVEANIYEAEAEAEAEAVTNYLLLLQDVY